MPIPQTQVNLRSYFETGDVPTQAQFAEFIDTMFYLYQQSQNTANAAVAAAAAATSATGRVLAKWTNAAVPVTVMSSNTQSIVRTATAGGFYTFRVTFLTPFNSVNYLVLPTITTGVGGTANPTILTKTTNYIDVQMVVGTYTHVELVLFGLQ